MSMIRFKSQSKSKDLCRPSKEFRDSFDAVSEKIAPIYEKADRKKLQQEINQIVKGSRGPKRMATKVSIRLNDEVIEYFKEQGAGWQTRINEVLAEYVKSQSK